MKKISITNDLNRPPELPSEILEKIFYLLPNAEDAVRMSLVSKSFKTLWDSLPQFHYRYNLLDDDAIVTSEQDETLTIFNQNQDGHPKRKIGSFKIQRKLGEFDHLIDQKLMLVTKHRLISLDISIFDQQVIPIYPQRYCFPGSPKLDLGALERLSLGYCILDKALVDKNGTTKLNCLKSLDLYDVEFNGNFWELLSMCPTLEILGVKFCRQLGDPNQPLRCYSCSTPSKLPKSVGTFRYASSRCTTDCQRFDHIEPNTLEVLHIQTRNSRFTDGYMDTLTSSFPSLIELKLEASGFGTLGTSQWKISSKKLESLTIIVSDYPPHVRKPIKINLKTPNLGYFSYNGPVLVPSLFRKQDCMNVKVLNFSLWSRIPADRLDTRWFLALREYIGKNFLQLEEFALELQTGLSPNITFDPNELKNVIIPPPPKVLDVSLRLPARDINKKFIGALLWSVHPINLSIELSHSGHSLLQKTNFLKFIQEKLMCLEAYLLWCDDLKGKCCRHCLESVKMKTYFSIKEDGKRHDVNSINNLEDDKESIGATFELQWLDA